MKKQCSLCGEWLDRAAFNGMAKDCSDCRRYEASRPQRGQAPVERAMTPKNAKQNALAKIRMLNEKTGKSHELDHVIPIRSKIKSGTDDWILICGLDVPENWEILLKEANRSKWMRFSKADAKAEEERVIKRLDEAR
jgi:5-methylcytosine-specific restriction endonuclease McrA